MRKQRFEAELIEGHKGVTVVLVPFDPEVAWHQKPVKLEGRRQGWLVKGAINSKRFEGYIGLRWSRLFIIVDDELRQAAGVAVGEMLSVFVEPASGATVLEKARRQSKVTTQPAAARRRRAPVGTPRRPGGRTSQ